MASAGTGTPNHMSGELFKMMSGVNMVHVPYRGGGPALTDLLGGQVQVTFSPISTSIGYIRASKLRAPAVTTATRSEVLPDVPTVAEFLPGYEASTWAGVGAPKNTPAEIVDKLNKEINAAFADPATRARFDNLGGAVLPGSPVDFGNLVSDDTEKWAKVIKFAGIKPEIGTLVTGPNIPWICEVYSRDFRLESWISNPAFMMRCPRRMWTSRLPS